VTLADAPAPGLVVKSDVASKQLDAERATIAPAPAPGDGASVVPQTPGAAPLDGAESAPAKPKPFHGRVVLDATRLGRDAGEIAEEVISHLAGLVGAEVTVTPDIDATVPSGAPDNVVRTVTENSRTLKFSDQGFESE